VQFKNDPQFLNAPVGYALAVINQNWAAGLVSAGAVAGITSVLLVMLMSQPRIFFSMSRDKLLPPGVSKVHPKFKTPYITTIITCVIVAIAAGFIPIQVVGEMTSIGTLFAFVVVSLAVLVLRSKRPDAHRPFKVAGGPVIPVLGVASCLYLMVSLSVMTWTRFLLWLDVGMLIYWFYGRTHSALRDPRESARQSGLEATGNLVTIVGSLVAFNGLAIALLGLLTEWGVTNEGLAKWAELDGRLSYIGLHVNPEIADRFGLTILGIGAVLLILGLVLRRAGRRTA
jgi:amino acid transporter